MATFSNAATCLQHYVHAKHFKCLFCGWGGTAEEEQKMHFEREGGRNYMSVHVLLLLGGKRREKKEGTSCPIFLSPLFRFPPKKGKEKGSKNANDSVARPPSPTYTVREILTPFFCLRPFLEKERKGKQCPFFFLGLQRNISRKKAREKKVCLVTAALPLWLKKPTKVAISPKKPCFCSIPHFDEWLSQFPHISLSLAPAASLISSAREKKNGKLQEEEEVVKKFPPHLPSSASAPTYPPTSQPPCQAWTGDCVGKLRVFLPPTPPGSSQALFRVGGWVSCEPFSSDTNYK